MERRPDSPAGVVRGAFGAATVGFALFGWIIGDDPRWLAASAAAGTLWFAWDLLVDYVFGPIGNGALRLLTEGTGERLGARTGLDQAVHQLEAVLEADAPRHVKLLAAVRLEEIYRVVKKDPERARQLIRRVREQYPDAPELSHYDAGGSPLTPSGSDPER